MWILYLIAIIATIVGGVLWMKFKEIKLWEWLVSAGIAFAISGLFHVFIVYGMTSDVETWSGRISYAVHYPRWVEQYQEAVYKTETYRDSKGNTHTRRDSSHYETPYPTHPEHWKMTLDFGTVEETHRISKGRYTSIKNVFGNKIRTTQPYKSGFYSGDKNIYTAYNNTGKLLPVTTRKSWTNRVKAAPSVFSYVKVPEGSGVFEYPANKNIERSDRLLGTTGLNIFLWDCMNSRLGPTKKVNVIMVGFKGDSSLADLQEAKWVGGKKNDLVLCVGYKHIDKPVWSRVFGWTEREDVKRNLETILIKNPINNDIIPLIEEEIRKNYVIKDWSKFDYITLEPPWWSYFVLLLVSGAIQALVLVMAFKNESTKDEGTPF
jgi:hypothetical protein